MPEQTADTRSILNGIASVRAGQEQMQKDVDQLRAGQSATIVLCAYAVAIGVVICFLVRKGLSS